MNESNPNNRTAVSHLKSLGYPLVNIRKALPKLTGLEHHEVAVKIGKSRQTVTNTMNGERNRPEVQAEISAAYSVPVDELFEKESGKPE